MASTVLSLKSDAVTTIDSGQWQEADLGLRIPVDSGQLRKLPEA